MQCLYDYEDNMSYEQLRWYLLKLCCRHCSNKIHVYEIDKDGVKDKLLAQYEGRTKIDKIESLIQERVNVDDMFIISPDDEFHF